MKIEKEMAYLIGLMCGRGHIVLNDKKIVIEFAHKNKVAYGIAVCDKCSYLATSQDTGKGEKQLVCKKCGKVVPASKKKIYEQRDSTIESLQNEIIPFLKKGLDIESDFVGNDHLTFLILDFEKEKLFDLIVNLFNNKTSFDSFEIPKEMWDINMESKKEFINGLMDTAGFFNAGSWMPRKCKNGYGVMRGYFQIVRNWIMPINICDYLYENFSLTIQTIDWGHPNMRDQKKIYGWGREHQVKFFPEQYGLFAPKLIYKKEMFDELAEHNKRIKSKVNDSFGLTKINSGQIKPYHPEENSQRLPDKIRGKHFDSSWQIALDLGCRLIENPFKESKHKEGVYLTGIDKKIDIEKARNEIEKIRKEKTKEVEASREKEEENIKRKEEKRIRTNLEQELYAPLCEYLSEFYSKLFNEEVIFYDTSSYYLHKFISNSQVGEKLEYYEEYKIKPDLVGFVISSQKLLMAEIKATDLSLKDLGQLRGYCLVADPEVALLVSNKEISLNLKKILKLNKPILEYNQKQIEIDLWDGEKLNKQDIENVI